MIDDCVDHDYNVNQHSNIISAYPKCQIGLGNVFGLNVLPRSGLLRLQKLLIFRACVSAVSKIVKRLGQYGEKVSKERSRRTFILKPSMVCCVLPLLLKCLFTRKVNFGTLV